LSKSGLIMPRNPSTGAFNLPPNVRGIPGSKIDSQKYNSVLDDLTTTLNAPWPVNRGGTGTTSLAGFLSEVGALPVAGGTMTGPLVLSDDAAASLNPVTFQQFNTAIAGKADAAHTHTASEISDFDATVAASLGSQVINSFSDVVIASPLTGQGLVYNGTNWVNGVAFTEIDKGILTNSIISHAHGLGVRPKDFEVFYECVTAEFGYVAGDRVRASNCVLQTYYLMFVSDQTHVRLVPRIPSHFVVTSRVSQDFEQITYSRWKIIFRIYP
jgi:hypothetical protein